MASLAMPHARKATPKNSDPCIYCGDPVLMAKTSAGRGKMAHRACRLAKPAAKRDDVCSHCSTTFTAVKRSDGRWTKACSKSCARKLEVAAGSHLWSLDKLTPEESTARAFKRGEQARRKRRARLAKVARDSYTTASIAERDERICGLCGEVVDLSIKWPLSGAAPVDHILPLSCGGDDTLANVQLAHAGCNLRKHNRV